MSWPPLLQRKIFVVIFGKVQSLCFLRNTLAGIIAKPPALVIRHPNSFFDAKNLTILKLCAIFAVDTKMFYFFTKQHTGTSGDLLQLLYTRNSGIATSFFEMQEKRKQKQQGDKRPKLNADTENQADEDLHQLSQKILPEG